MFCYVIRFYIGNLVSFGARCIGVVVSFATIRAKCIIASFKNLLAGSQLNIDYDGSLVRRRDWPVRQALSLQRANAI